MIKSASKFTKQEFYRKKNAQYEQELEIQENSFKLKIQQAKSISQYKKNSLKRRNFSTSQIGTLSNKEEKRDEDIHDLKQVEFEQEDETPPKKFKTQSRYFTNRVKRKNIVENIQI